ncbi:MAG: class I SAM-dependent methyltransferase [Nanoarchaeota archaeon]
MLEPNYHLSKSHFILLSSLLKSGRFSKSILEEFFLSCLSNPIQWMNLDCTNEEDLNGKSRKIKTARKKAQISGLISLITDLPKYEEIIDACSGNGFFTAKLAERFPQTYVVGLDNNSVLVRKTSLAYSGFPNLSFQTLNLFSANLDLERKSRLITSLHGCGGLIDKAIDLAISSEADFVGVPCCYSKIKLNYPSLSLPRSRALSDKTEEYNAFLKHASESEGSTSRRTTNIAAVLGDVFRILVNFDRLFYLQQNGYKTHIVPIADKFIFSEDGKNHINTPHRYALVGVRRK